MERWLRAGWGRLEHWIWMNYAPASIPLVLLSLFVWPSSNDQIPVSARHQKIQMLYATNWYYIFIHIFYLLMITVRLEGREYFEAFVLEARALGGGPTNKQPQAGVGRFVGAPRTTMFLSCRDRPNSAVVNAPNPVRMNNLTFTWEAPFQDVGDIYFM